MALAHRGAMRFLLPCSLVLLAAGGAVACAAKIDEPSERPTGEPAATPAPLCIATSAARCAAALDPTADEPPRDGAILWAKAPPDTAGATLAAARLAVYPDGTLRRTPVIRNLDALVMPPRGLVRARIASASLAQLRADVEAAASDPRTNMHAFFAPDAPPHEIAGANVLDLGVGSACFLRPDHPSSSCVPAALGRVHADVAALLDASERLWRDARSGTVSLAAEVTPQGRWPLAQDVTDGTLDLTREEWSRVGRTGLFRLDGGDLLYVNLATAKADGGELVYVSRVSAITLDDAQADVRDDLLANVGRYEASKGTWLGVPLGADRFPAFKNREIAIVPATDTEPERLYSLKAIETFDLEGEAPIALP